MKKFLTLCFLLALVCVKGRAQTILISPTGAGGFELGNSFALNGWNKTQSGVTRRWRIGNAANVQDGANAAYVGSATQNNGSNQPTVQHFYRDVAVPAGATNVLLSFYYKQPVTDNTGDSFYVFTTSAANVPVADRVPDTGYTPRFVNAATAYTNYTAIPSIDLSSLAGTTFRIVFTFKSNGIIPHANPAVDNISLVYTSLCNAPVASIVSAPTAVCSGEGAGVVINSSAPGTLTYTTQINRGSAVPHTTSVVAGNNILGDVVTETTTFTLINITGTAGCAGSASGSVKVKVNPLPIVASIEGSNLIAVGKTVTLSDSTPNGTWTSSDSNILNIVRQNNVISPATARVNGVSVGSAVITYTTRPNRNGCVNAVEFPVQVYNSSLTLYRTNGSGNFSGSIWQRRTNTGTWVSSGPPDGTNTNIEIRDSLTMDVDYNGTINSFIRITNRGIINGVLKIAPNHILSSQGGVDFNSKSVIVQSDASGSGAIGQMANTIGGADNVTVERYTDGGNSVTGRRAWRLLTAPVTDKTIHQTWQEGRTWTGGSLETITGVGTLITGEATGGHVPSSSFDYIPNSAHHTSIKQYYAGATTGLWDVLTGNDADGTDIPVRSQPAWLVFVRGDRTQTSTSSGVTLLRSIGTLNQVPATVTVDNTKAYTLVGNPYAAPINFDNIYNSSISSTFVVWNSQQGVFGAYNYITRNGVDDYTVVPFDASSFNSSAAKFIQSGSGFFVSSASTTASGSITIDESSKNQLATGGVNTFREMPIADRKLWVNLNLKDSDTSATVADGVLWRFDASYENGIDANDALKQTNLNENVGISSQSSSLMIECRPDVQERDTLFMKLWNVTKRSYQFQIKADNFTTLPSLQAWLVDNYLGTKQPISLQGDVTTLDFSVTGDSLSSKSDRFMVVFENSAVVLPVTLTSVKAAPQNGGVSVTWTVSNETNIKGYTLERSADGGRTYTGIGAQQAAKNSGSGGYQGFDSQPQKGDNLYRIRIEAKEGTVTYSSVVKATIGEEEERIEITLYPNPVREGKVNLQMTHLPQGTYEAKVYSQGGQTVYQRQITVSGSRTSQSEELRLGKAIAQGAYQLRLTDSRGKVLKEVQLVTGK